MSAGDPLGVAVVGLGFMGRTHVEAYAAAHAAGFPNRLVAVCDSDPERRAGRTMQGGNVTQGSGAELLFDPELVRGHERAEDLFESDDVQLVSICTHTSTHVELACAALAAGKHVLLEKPVALSAADMQPLVEAAATAEGRCMPAHCMRFWPGWDWLAERVRAGTFGAPRSAVFKRLGSRPDWSPVYEDLEATGGALVDMHMHDVDFVRHVFGEPRSVQAGGSLHHVTALYQFEDGPGHVSAEGGWDHTGGFPFRMGFVVVCEEATLEYDSGREAPLLVHRGGSSEAVELEVISGYDGEVRHLLRALANDQPELRVSVQDALGTAHLLDAERSSLASGQRVPLV